MSSGGVSRLRPTATLRLVTSTPNPDKDEDSDSSLSSFSSHASVEEPSRGRTQARQVESNKPVKTPLQIKVLLARQTETVQNTVAQDKGIENDNSDRKESTTEPVQVDEDWKMGSPSPIKLTYATAHFHQLYEDEDIVMASPTDFPGPPSPKEVQDPSSWAADPHRPPTPKEAQYSATRGSSTRGADPHRPPTPKEVQDSATRGSSTWGADPPPSPTPKEARDSATWGSSWGADSPCSPTSKQIQDSSTWGSPTWEDSPWVTDPSRSPTRDSATWGSSTW